MSSYSLSEEAEEKERIEKAKQAVETLQRCLKTIVTDQKKELQGNEEYQKKFYKLCNDIGVDPFTQKKGFLSGLLNKNLDEYYKRLGMQVLTVCLNTRYENGGLIKLKELKDKVNALRNGDIVHRDDIRVAIHKLSVLSSSLSIESIDEGSEGLIEYVKSADMEFSGDSLKILAKATRRKGIVQAADMGYDINGKWVKELDLFVNQGLAWIDSHNGVSTYYFPSIVFADCTCFVIKHAFHQLHCPIASISSLPS